MENIYNLTEIELKTIYLMPGEIIGNKPNDHFFKFKGRVFILVLFGFLINHLFYYKRTKSFKIPFNKREWDHIVKSMEEQK